MQRRSFLGLFRLGVLGMLPRQQSTPRSSQPVYTDSDHRSEAQLVWLHDLDLTTGVEYGA